MKYILCVRKLFGEERFIIRGVRSFTSCNDIFFIKIFQDHIAFSLNPVIEYSLGGVDLVRNNGYLERLKQAPGNIGDTVRSNEDRYLFPGCSYDLIGFGTKSLILDGNDILGKEIDDGLLKLNCFERFEKVSVKALSSVKSLVFTAGICGHGNYGNFPVKPSSLLPDGMETFDTVHIRHHMIH